MLEEPHGIVSTTSIETGARASRVRPATVRHDSHALHVRLWWPDWKLARDAPRRITGHNKPGAATFYKAERPWQKGRAGSPMNGATKHREIGSRGLLCRLVANTKDGGWVVTQETAGARPALWCYKRTHDACFGLHSHHTMTTTITCGPTFARQRTLRPALLCTVD